MFRELKQKWRGLKHGQPGHRFRDTYETARRQRRQTPTWHRILRLGIAVVALAVGAALLVLPGPAFVFLGVGGALLAIESRVIAVRLDGFELHARHAATAWQRSWKKLTPITRGILLTLGATGSAAAACLITWVLFLR